MPLAHVLADLLGPVYAPATPAGRCVEDFIEGRCGVLVQREALGGNSHGVGGLDGILRFAVFTVSFHICRYPLVRIVECIVSNMC